ncbi:TPR-like protein, partial [Rhizoclosmatium globosum]
MTEASKKSLCEQWSQSPSKSSIIKNATWFVSHAWKDNFLDVIDALDSFFANQQNTTGVAPESQIIWFDLFSNSQHDTTLKEFSWWETTFRNAIKQIGNVILVLQPFENPYILTRVWCIYEVYSTNVTGASFNVAMTPAQSEKLVNTLRIDSSEYHRILARVSCKKAEATNIHDKTAIFELVSQSVGFVTLDRTVFGVFSKWIVSTLTQYMEKAERGSAEYFDWVYALGSFESLSGNYGVAEKLLREAYEGKKMCRKVDPDTLKSLNTLAKLYESTGRYSDAEPLLIECLNDCENTLGQSDRETLTAMNNLALLYKSQVRYDECEPLASKCYHLSLERYGEEDPDTIRNMKNLALLYYCQSRFSEAEQLNIKCLKLSEKILGPSHLETVMAKSDLGMLYMRKSRAKESEKLLFECLQARQAMLGYAHPMTTMSMHNWGMACYQQHRVDEAISTFKECLEIRRATLGQHHPSTLTTVGFLGRVCLDQGNMIEAEEYLTEKMVGCKETFGPGHPKTTDAVYSLAYLRIKQKR